MNIRLVFFIFSLLLAYNAFASEYMELSDHFAVKSVSGLLSSNHTEVFAREKKNGKYKLIGTTRASHWDKPFSGAALEALQASVIAVSIDGKSLLYWHNNIKTFLGPKKYEGIYWYSIGEGEKLLYAESELNQFWHRYDKDIPKNIMVLQSPAFTTEKLWALNAEDASLIPLGLLGSTPLHMAVYQNDLVQVRSALQQGMSINEYNYWGFTPLEIGIKKGFDDIAIYLIEQGADYTHRTEGYLSAIQLSVYLQRWKVINAIHKTGGKLSDSELLSYSMFGYYSQLISDDIGGYSPNDVPKMIELILKDSEDPIKENVAIIYHLFDTKSLHKTKIMLETLKLLLNHGANPNAVENYKQRTPLHLIASEWAWNDETKQVIDLLTFRMKSLEARDKFGLTALQVTMLRPELGDGFRKALYLIQSGANDSVEYLCGDMAYKMGKSIRQIIDEWEGKLPEHYNCSAS